MSEIKVNKLTPRTNCGTVQLGDSGDTITIPAGATITNSGTAAGFGATGAASWDTTVKTTGFTAVSGVGYFVNTTSGAITVTLPASPDAGAVVAVSDYAGTSDTNNITIGRNGSNINGAAADLTVSNENSAITLVYVDSTQGWKATDTSSLNDIALQPAYVTATGGTITECGNFKIHTFTGPGTFTVSCVGNPIGSTSVDYLVVAGGGGGGRGATNSGNSAGGGGAGGYRESSGASSGCYSASPLGACVSALPVTATGYPIKVGAGGTAVALAPACTPNLASENSGSNSIFSTITSAGGGGGGNRMNSPLCAQAGASGGSGGGGTSARTGGTGNTPPVSPAQGTSGGTATGNSSGGGGGATVAGSPNASVGPINPGGPGGAGATTSISASPTAYAGGGGGGGSSNGSGAGGGTGGTGGGGKGADEDSSNAVAGITNRGGGGGGGSGSDPGSAGANGGSGIVIIRYKFQN